MTDKKHDLTRIEDLGEFLHELQNDATSTSFGLDDLTEATATSLPPEESPFTEFEETPSTQEDTLFSEDTIEEAPEFENETVFESAPDYEEPLFSPTGNSSLVTAMVEETFEADRNQDSIFKQEIESYKTPENFEDIKKFAESTSFTGLAMEGNPSFSVLIKNVRYIEDVNDIMAMLSELKLINDPEDQVRARLSRGAFLVPRISEFAAIYLAHKLRRFDIDIQVGLSDEIHPPKHQEKPETGLISKFNLYQNQSHHFHFEDPKLELSQITVSSTSTLDGHQINKYLGVASEFKIIDAHQVEDESSSEIPLHYQELALKLKAHALKASANAVVGLNYQLTPISSQKYRLSCTGNLVWVNKQ